MVSLFRKNPPSPSAAVDEIEAIVYAYLKPLGFTKHGRTLHRFVDEDISQVVHLQNGCPAKGVSGVLWVNLGIRVPECALRSFSQDSPRKKYYPEYACNIRCRLGTYVDGRDTGYSLKKDPRKIGAHIVSRLARYVLPVFDALNSREAILRSRRDYPGFDAMHSGTILLDEAMIWGRRGDRKKAEELFQRHCAQALADYRSAAASGTQVYLKKGEKIAVYNPETGRAETIVGQQDGCITVNTAGSGHLAYLEALAKELGFSMFSPA